MPQLPLLPTSLVGSYAQPDWLIDREALPGIFPPRTRMKGLWRVPEEYLEQAWDDATVYAIAEQERAGLDIITDGEMRRESYSNRFATALDGVDMDNHGTALDRSGEPVPVPRVTGPIKRRHAVQVRDVQFLREHASPGKAIKITVPGPFTMSQQAQDDYYNDPRGARGGLCRRGQRGDQGPVRRRRDVVQLDEPYMQARPDKARTYRPEGARARARGRARARPRCTSASATRT